ncbi:hypothetical protein BDZ91DRAFT_769142 [Kalaharituber pfeilii]|nr:hypothetical protein BDZ91DRAFT_769142 [Kalaharituber pfeilii]
MSKPESKASGLYIHITSGSTVARPYQEVQPCHSLDTGLRLRGGFNRHGGHGWIGRWMKKGGTRTRLFEEQENREGKQSYCIRGASGTLCLWDPTAKNAYIGGATGTLHSGFIAIGWGNGCQRIHDHGYNATVIVLSLGYRAATMAYWLRL